MRFSLLKLSALAAALVLFISPLGQPQAPVSVSIQNFAFSPATITVPVGTTVTWTNKDSVAHTVTSRNGTFDSGTLHQGDTFQFTFNSPGTYDYYCTIHPSMTGRVIVTSQAGEEVQEFALIHSLKDGRIYPSTLTVKRGVKVHLFNTATDATHDPVIISSDEAGTKPVFGVEGFRVEVGRVTTVEFTPDREGEFFITHRRHGHDIIGKLLVIAP